MALPTAFAAAALPRETPSGTRPVSKELACASVGAGLIVHQLDVEENGAQAAEDAEPRPFGQSRLLVGAPGDGAGPAVSFPCSVSRSHHSCQGYLAWAALPGLRRTTSPRYRNPLPL